MDRSTNRLAIIVGVAAAAAGVAVASYFYFRRAQSAPPLRNVSDILTDAYTKMREIQSHLTQMHPPDLQPSQGS